MKKQDNHYYEIQFAYEMDPSKRVDGSWQHLECELNSVGSSTPGEGLHNGASLRDVLNKEDLEDDDCIPVDQPDNPFVKIEKVDAEDRTTPLEAGFDIYPSNASGELVSKNLQTALVDIKNGGVVVDGVFTVQIADVKTGTLPKTGDSGVGWLALLGVALGASAIALSRRNSRRIPA